MNNFFSTALGRFRIIGIAEGISFLILIGIAMPLKYFAGIPYAVKIAGWIHGVLFILYLVSLAHVTVVKSWGIFRVCWAFIASLLPFGTLILDAQLKKEQRNL